VCQDPYLGYTKRYLHVALEIHRIDVLFVSVFVTLSLDTLCSTGASCIVYRDHCRIPILSVDIVTVVLDSACSTDTVLCCIWESLFD